jgi:hypothetical protein
MPDQGLVGDQVVAERIADSHVVHAPLQISPQPVRHGTFLETQIPWPRNRLQQCGQLVNCRPARHPFDKLTIFANNGKFASQLVRIQANVVGSFHRGLHALSETGTKETPVYSTLTMDAPSSYIFTP